LGRKSILIDVKKDYCGLMLRRMKQPGLPFLTSNAPVASMEQAND